MSETTIAIEPPDQPDVLTLLEASDKYHAALYPSESNHLVDVSALKANNVRFLVARNSAGTAIGCGAVLISRERSVISGELKRMWIAPNARGTGLGRRLLSQLEAVAIDEGATTLQLETGVSQPEAIQLYKSSGFDEC